MIQDIGAHRYSVAFEPSEPTDDDILLIFKGNNILVYEQDGRTWFPSVGGFDLMGDPVFLFRIDDMDIYMLEVDDELEFEGWQFVPPEYFRNALPAWKAFAGITAVQLHRWYENNMFCSRCGGKMLLSRDERAVVCQSCGRVVYPSIAPCVIVAITNGDKLLMTKYNPKNHKYSRYALVAGYNEIGETLEDTVRREVMEEVGLKVKNIRYFGNQPWSFTDTLLVGFFCELDGSPEIKMDDDELSFAQWFTRDEIPKMTSTISLTNTMIEHFRTQE